MWACSLLRLNKTCEQLFRDLHDVDDAALVAHTERALQCLTRSFAEAAQLLGLEVSLKKTEVLHQPAPREEYRLSHITIGETVLRTVHQSTYLGCTITSDAKIDREAAASEEGHQEQRVQSCRSHHLIVGL